MFADKPKIKKKKKRKRKKKGKVPIADKGLAADLSATTTLEHLAVDDTASFMSDTRHTGRRSLDDIHGGVSTRNAQDSLWNSTRRDSAGSVVSTAYSGLGDGSARMIGQGYSSKHFVRFEDKR